MRSRLLLTFFAALSTLVFSSVASAYTDLDDNHIYSLAISGLVNGGAVEGYSDNTFKPDQAINRAEFLKIALAWYDEDVAALDLSGSNCYDDVRSEWFAPYVCAATDLGFVEGYSNNLFRPELPINFAEASKIIAKVFNLPIQAEETENWYHPYAEALSSEGLIPPTLVSFAQEVNRGEMAEMVYWSTYSGDGKWNTTYDDLQNGLLEHYRVVYSSPGASTSYPYLIDGTSASLLGIFVTDASLSLSNTRLSYMEYDPEMDTTNLLVKDLPSDETLYIFPDIEGGETSGFSWSDDASTLYWTGISYENTEYDGVVNAYTLDLTTETVNSFETNSWYHCGSICVPSPFVWSESGDYGAILSFNYDDNGDEYNFFYVYNSLGQELYFSSSLDRMNDTPTSYEWDETGKALVVEYSDGTSVSVEVILP